MDQVVLYSYALIVLLLSCVAERRGTPVILQVISCLQQNRHEVRTNTRIILAVSTSHLTGLERQQEFADLGGKEGL